MILEHPFLHKTHKRLLNKLSNYSDVRGVEAASKQRLDFLPMLK